eukprot:1441127-Rhodomonas_salina.1
MYSTGICDITFSWGELIHPEYTTDNPPPDTLLDTLAEVIMIYTRVETYWSTGEGIQTNMALAEAIRTVTAAGWTHADQFVHPCSGGWWTDVDMPQDQYALLM